MGKAGKASRMKKVLKFPMRLLVIARDFYVNGMSQLSEQMRYDAVATMGCPSYMGSAALPRSFSASVVGSTNSRSDHSELIRAASARGRLGNRTQGPAADKEDFSGRGGAGKVPRSYSVGLGRIEEEKSDDLGEDYAFGSGSFHRSKSCAVSAAGGTMTGKLLKPVAAASVS